MALLCAACSGIYSTNLWARVAPINARWIYRVNLKVTEKCAESMHFYEFLFLFLFLGG